MTRPLIVLVALLLVAHGLIHLLGTIVCARLGQVEGLVYKTRLFGGRWDVGTVGISLFGVLWLLPAIGFVAGAFGLLSGWSWWPPVLVATSVISLVLAGLDWSNACVGGVVDMLVLAATFFSTTIVRALS